MGTFIFAGQVALAQDILFDPEPAPKTQTKSDSQEAEEDLKNVESILAAPTPAPEPAKQVAPTVPRKTPAELAGLGRLAPFSDIAMISKRFLPKTKRFEIFPNVGLILNDAFFTDLVYGGRLGYYFTEHYGVEITGLGISSSNKSVTTELAERSTGAISTTALATPTYYVGADLKWSPIYGKMGFLNKSVVPFDVYFSLGGGVTGTNQKTTPPTLHLGAGQIFAVKKWMAIRWDISWFAYKTDTTVVDKPGGTYTNLHATIGASFFFPEAKYR